MTHPLRQEITDIVMGSSLRGMYNTGWEDQILALIEVEKRKAVEEAVVKYAYVRGDTTADEARALLPIFMPELFHTPQ